MTPEIAERIQKLLRLSKSSNPHEAASALETAKKLMEKFNVTEADIFPEEEVKEVLDTQRGFHRERLALLVSKAFKCQVGILGDSLMIRGKESEVRKAKNFYSAMVAVGIPRSVCPDGHLLPNAANHVWQSVFWLGFIDAVTKQIQNKSSGYSPEPRPRSRPADQPYDPIGISFDEMLQGKRKRRKPKAANVVKALDKGMQQVVRTTAEAMNAMTENIAAVTNSTEGASEFVEQFKETAYQEGLSAGLFAFSTGYSL